MLRVQPENWEVPPDSFFQNNFFLLPKLVETVREFLKASGSRHLIDLYCGVGFFGIETADAVESFVGVELMTKLGDQGRASKNATHAPDQKWRIPRRQSGRRAAGTAAKVFRGKKLR